MKNSILKISLFTATLFMFTLAGGQNPSTMLLISQLSDIEGETVQNKQVNVALEIINSAGVSCYSEKMTAETNEFGGMVLSASNLSPIFPDAAAKGPAVIQLTLTSENDDSWLEESRFIVKYLLKRENRNGETHYSLTRMEGQKTNIEFEADIWKFSDIYPLAYIKCEFLFSFNSDITDPDTLMMAAQELFGLEMNDSHPASDAAPASSRGLKGGYAVGGIKKK